MKENQNQRDLFRCGERWKGLHQDALDAKDLRYSSCTAPEEIKASPWFSTLSARQQQCLAYNLMFNPGATSVSVTQTLTRTPCGSDGHVSTILPDSLNWVVDPQIVRPLLGIESLHIQRYPQGKAAAAIETDQWTEYGLTDHDLQDFFCTKRGTQHKTNKNSKA